MGQKVPDEVVITSLQTIVPLPEVLTVTEQLPEEEEEDEDEDDTDTEEDVVLLPDELETVTLQLPDDVEDELDVDVEPEVDEQLLVETLSIVH